MKKDFIPNYNIVTTALDSAVVCAEIVRLHFESETTIKRNFLSKV